MVMTPRAKYYDSLKLISLATPSLENQSSRIYSRWLEEFVYRKDVFSSWKNMSEQDIVARYYEPVFSTLFGGSGISLRFGETENNESKEAQKIARTFDNGIRGALKVDLRVCFQNEGKYYDVCSVEFARDGDIERKCVSDAAKVTLEGKCILDQTVEIAKVDDDDAKELQVLNLQFCGKITLYKNLCRALRTCGFISALISVLGLKGSIIGIRFEKTKKDM
ncbi:hypothetical protein MFLAVUS_004791 [Mucor flavus]|uniref:Uncharacterized protein n=1 Tax=Mucor flavus TaxID=439312 RepID=A0ABP9YWY6_9FUNG